MTNPGRLRFARPVALANAGVALLLGLACDAVDGGGLAGDSIPATVPANVEQTQQAVITESKYYDDSAAPVHVMVKMCKQNVAWSGHTVSCQVDLGYHLIGGGAQVGNLTTGWGAFLTESRPVDNKTWQASSKEHIYPDAHTLTTYAVGFRVDGTSFTTLGSRLRTGSSTSPTVSHPQICPSSSEPVWTNISGGALVNWTGYGSLLTRLDSGCAAAKDHIYYSPASITLFQRQILREPIEGFGMLDVKEQTVTAPPVASGNGGALVSVDPSWAIASYGGQAYYQGMGRMLWGLGPREMDLRTPIAWSSDHTYPDSGSTAVTWTQIRKRPNSHSLCAAGSPLSSDMGTCVSSICATQSYCCSWKWDNYCVGLVKSKCGLDCAAHTCSIPSYHPDFWNDCPYPLSEAYKCADLHQGRNCYAYARNRTDVGTPGQDGVGGRRVGCEDLKAGIVSDGLIPIDKITDPCPEGRSRVAYVQGFDGFHFYRQDSMNYWSHKPGPGSLVTDRDEYGRIDNTTNTPKVVAERFGYVFCGYACTCSSSTEGQGRQM